MDLLLILPNLSTLSQAIAPVVRCDNRLFECQQEKGYKPTSTTQRNFAPLTTQKSFPPVMLTQLLATLPKKDFMQIDKTRFKPFTE
jgi:hypothetical protein